MIDQVVGIIADKLRQGLPAISLVAGVASPQKLDVDGRIKTLPAARIGATSTFLTPVSSESGIVYFEVLSNRAGDSMSGGRTMYVAQVRCVAWINTERVTPTDPNVIMSHVVSLVAQRHTEQPPIAMINVTPIAEVPRTPAIFSRHTYDEAEWQYLSLPFEYFAFDFNIQYALNQNCDLPNVITTSPSC